MHIVIPVSVRGKIASAPKDVEYVCGNSDFSILFDFSEEWAEHDLKTARFKYNGTYREKVFNGNECPVPIISDTFGIEVGVYAGNLKTTTAAYIPAKKSILCGGGLPDDPPSDVYAQLVSLTEEARAAAKDVQQRADAGEFDGKDGEDGKDATAEEYVLIEEYTMTESAWFMRNAEPDWTPYNFKRFLLIMETDGMAMGTNMQVRSGDEIIAQSWLYDKDNSDGSKHLSAFLSVDIENGAMYVQAANTWLEGTGANLVNGISRFVGDKTVTSVGFSAMMPAGMTIRIYGVRA